MRSPARTTNNTNMKYPEYKQPLNYAQVGDRHPRLVEGERHL